MNIVSNVVIVDVWDSSLPAWQSQLFCLCVCLSVCFTVIEISWQLRGHCLEMADIFHH